MGWTRESGRAGRMFLTRRSSEHVALSGKQCHSVTWLGGRRMNISFQQTGGVATLVGGRPSSRSHPGLVAHGQHTEWPTVAATVRPSAHRERRGRRQSVLACAQMVRLGRPITAMDPASIYFLILSMFVAAYGSHCSPPTAPGPRASSARASRSIGVWSPRHWPPSASWLWPHDLPARVRARVPRGRLPARTRRASSWVATCAGTTSPGSAAAGGASSRSWPSVTSGRCAASSSP